MRILRRGLILIAAAFMVTTSVPTLYAQLILNGGFEAGLSDWITVNQIGSDGTFWAQSGTTSPSSGDTVPAPPGGNIAAMSDAQGPGSHVLYQDFVVPLAIGPVVLNFDLFIGNRADAFYLPDPATLDFATAALNQQARVDILPAGGDPFDLAGVLLAVYQTEVDDSLESGYNPVSADLTALFAAHQGQTLRLRFAEVDNVFTFQMGIDNVAIVIVPEPAAWLTAMLGIAALLLVARRSRRASR